MKNLGIILIAAGVLLLVLHSLGFVPQKELVETESLGPNKKGKEPDWFIYSGVTVVLVGLLIVLNEKEKIKSI